MKSKLFLTVSLLCLFIISLSSCRGNEPLRPKPDGPTEEIAVDKITITNEDVKTSLADNKYVVIYADENGDCSYQIEYEITPSEATNKKVEFIYDTQNTAANVDKYGLVTFKGLVLPRSVTVYVAAADDSGVRDSIEITAFPLNLKPE